MRTIHYSIRLLIMLTMIGLAYWGVALLLHQTVQLATAVTLLFITPMIERLWAILEWMGPVIGSVNWKERERGQKRIIEHQLARSLRYGSRLVIAAMREKKRTSLHVIEKNLRNTDIVLRDSSGYLIALMPDTTIKQANNAFKRLMSLMPLRDIVVMDEGMLQSVISGHGIDMSGSARRVAPHSLREICIQLLNAKLASIPLHMNGAEEQGISLLFEAETPEAQSERSQERSLAL